MDKQLVAQRFGLRATSYDEAAFVQKQMQDKLVDELRVAAGHRDIRRILELGCGTGGLTQQLSELFPQAEIVAIDISPEMVELASRRCPQTEFVVADAELFVQQESSRFDLITSSATVQWFDDPVTTLRTCCARLSERGLIWMSTFGEQTFYELRSAFDAAYRDQRLPAREHVMPFVSANRWRRTFPEAKLCQELMVLSHPDVRTFLRSLQSAGTSYSVDHRPLSRNTLMRMRRHYDQQFSTPHSDGIEVTYELLFLGLTVAAADRRSPTKQTPTIETDY